MPTVLADLHGRPSKTKPPPYEPKPQGDLYDPPDYFNEAQQEGWRYAINHAPPGLLKRIDRGVLSVWIVAESLHRQATIAQNKMASLLVGPAGNPLAAQQSQFLAIINRQGTIMLKAASELGFSPVARPRMGIVPGLPSALPSERTNATIAAAPPTRSLGQFLDEHPGTRH